MAGIGFSIERLSQKGTFSASVQAYFYATVIFSGPWILSILTILFLDIFAPANINLPEMIFFRTIIIYIFAFSFVTTGFFHFPLTRYLADQLYVGHKEVIVPAFNTSIFYVFLFQGILATVVLSLNSMALLWKILITLTYMTISSLWVTMIFLSTLRAFRVISLFYLIGSITAVFVSLFFGRLWGIEGYFIGYLLGHLLIVVLWSSRIFIEFSSERIFDSKIFLSLLQKRTLIFIGLFYNLAIWVDKIIFWLSPQAKTITAFFRTFPLYENPVFFAHLTIIPALSLLLIHIETDFYRKFRRFYKGIVDKLPFTHLQQLRADITHSLKSSILRLIRFQGTLALLIIVFALPVASFLHIPWVQIPIFRVAVLATFLHSLLLTVLILTLYFDFQWDALMIVGFFFLTNAVFTWMTVPMGILFYGYGYLLSTLMTLVVAVVMFDRKLRRLEYYTFALLPVG